MSRKFINRLKFLIAMPLMLSTAANAMSAYKVRIDEGIIRASKNDDVVEIKLQDSNLVVSQTPAEGFYGLKVGDRIVSVDATQVHKTNEFVDALGQAHGNDAKIEVIRQSAPVTVTLSRQGYSWFL